MGVIVVKNTETQYIESHGSDSFIETSIESVVEYPVETVQSIEVVTEGPQGAPGSIIDGSDDGDILRWNAATESWEAKQEPFEFNGIILTPQEIAILEAEGAVYYSSADKTIKVCVED